MRLLIIFILLFSVVHAIGQKEVDLKTLNIENGLSQSVVNDLLIDAKGFVWIGTQNGLNRYDGYSFKKYYSNPEKPYALSSDYITAIAEDANDNLWIGTRTGLNKFESRKQQFIHYGLSSNSLVFPEISIRALLVDSENFVWVLLSNYLIKINPVDEGMQIFAFGEAHENFESCASRSLYETSSGNIWFLKGNQLIMFDKVFERFEFFNLKNTYHHSCYQEIFEHNKTIYLTTDYALWQMEEKGQLQKMQHFESQIDVFTASDRQSDIMLVNNKGLFRFADESFKMSLRFHEEYTGVNRFFVSVATIDQAGNLWIGTSGKGLRKGSITPPKFDIIEMEVAQNEFLTDDQISSVLGDDQYYWLGTYEYGLNLVEKNSRNVKHIQVAGQDKLLNSNNVYDVKKIGEKYVVSTQKGLSILAFDSNGKLKSVEHNKLKNHNFHIYEVEPYDDHSFFYSFGGQLHYYDLATKNLKSWFFDLEKASGIANSYCIEKVEGDLIFIGTSHGLFRFDLRNNYWDRFLFQKDDTTSLTGNDVYALEYDQFGRLWVGTANGLSLVEDPFKRSLKFHYKHTGKNSTFYSIYSGKQYTWAGTGNGLLRFRYADSTINIFHREDGLPCDEFNIGAATQLPDGRLAFGGQGGVALFYADSLQLSSFNPNVVISDAYIYSHKGKRQVPVYSGATIELNVTDFLSNIYFAALDLTAPNKNRYRYKVDDSEWIYIGTQNYASFSNLQPGTYRISINGTNADRQWSTNIGYITLKVPRHWYNTWWAYTIYTLLLLIAILVGIETRTRRLRLTNQVLREKEASAKQVARQKDRLVVLHHNMTESMNYASRIQQALFPTNNTFKRILPDSFVLYRPKDIISGDFYWIAENGSKVIVAVVDCTGHGVPGALLSVIGIELLKKIVTTEGYEKPAEILDHLDQDLYSLLIDSDKKNDMLTDGMDMALCVIDRETMNMEFAGAMNSLYFISDNEFKEIKGDRIPVGMGENVGGFRYTNHFIEYTENDMFYLSTDGYSDQFGGEKNKKYKHKRFRNFLMSVSNHDMDMQQLLLENNFDKWRGNNEQLDDVLVVGFRITWF